MGEMIGRDDVQTVFNPATNAQSQAFLEQMELKRQGSQIAVPTDDLEVRAMLRKYNEPVTYFGEDKGDRRDRLRTLMVQKGLLAKEKGDEGEAEEEEEFYTQGEPELKQARVSIYNESIKHAKIRLEQQRIESEQPLETHVAERRKVFDRIANIDGVATQPAFNRPVSAVKFSPNNGFIAGADWSGSVQLFDENLEQTRQYTGHSGKVGGLAFNPVASHPSVFNLASGGVEGNVNLWTLDREGPLATLRDEEIEAHPIGKIDVHPTGRFVAAASHDYTWKMWDVTSEQLLLAQEGHSKQVSCCKFQCDGSLLASGGQDAIGRVWDLRTGHTIMILNGHVQAINALDFSPNGYQLVTASSDNSALVWDLRQGKSIATIPAHTSLVSDVCFYKSFIVTSSYDKAIKFWSADNWVHKQTLHESTKVLSLDIKDYNVVTGRWDRYIKLWT